MIFSLLIIFLAVIICRVKCLSVQLCFVLFSWAIVLPPPATTTKLDHYEHKQLHSFMKTAKRAAKEKLVNPTPPSFRHRHCSCFNRNLGTAGWDIVC